jgi:hypothetical protein
MLVLQLLAQSTSVPPHVAPGFRVSSVLDFRVAKALVIAQHLNAGSRDRRLKPIARMV